MKKLFAAFLFVALAFFGCEAADQEKTKNGISAKHAKAQLVVKKNSKGNSLEQQNIIDGYLVENTPGAVKHLYVISTFTGKVLRYSTVYGKVTSNSKTLQPSKTTPTSGIKFDNRGYNDWTQEVMQESGTYGSSSPYIFWFDTKGVYHKMLMNHNAYVEISNQPLPVSANGELVIKFQ